MCCHCCSSSHFAPVMHVHTHIFVCQIYLPSLMYLHWNMTLEVLSTIAGVLPGHVLGSSSCSCYSTCSPICHLHHMWLFAWLYSRHTMYGRFALFMLSAQHPACSSPVCESFWLVFGSFSLENIQEPNKNHSRVGEDEAGR